MEFMTPAEIVSKLFGVRALARELDLTPGAISHWKTSSGRVPSKYHEALLSLARRQRKHLTPYMLIMGNIKS